MTLVRNGAARPRGRRIRPRAAKAALASLLVASGWLASCSSTTTQTAGLEVIVKTDRVTLGVDFVTPQPHPAVRPGFARQGEGPLDALTA